MEDGGVPETWHLCCCYSSSSFEDAVVLRPPCPSICLIKSTLGGRNKTDPACWW